MDHKGNLHLSKEFYINKVCNNSVEKLFEVVEEGQNIQKNFLNLHLFFHKKKNFFQAVCLIRKN